MALLVIVVQDFIDNEGDPSVALSIQGSEPHIAQNEPMSPITCHEDATLAEIAAAGAYNHILNFMEAPAATGDDD